MTWRDGVHLTNTPIWCDARRRRDVCFVSSADRVGRTGHGQLIATPLTLALLGASGGGHLGVPLHRRFTLGTTRLELIASGRGPGAAALVVDVEGKPVVYAGAVRTASAPGLETAEVRECHAVVVSAPYGKREHKFAPLASAVDATLEHARRELAAGRRPALLVETVLDALEVAICFARAGIPIAAGRPIRDAAQRASSALADTLAEANARAARDAELRGASRKHAKKTEPATNGHAPDTRIAIGAFGKEPRALLWLARDRSGLARTLGSLPHSTTLLSATYDSDADHHFAWANAAGRDDLLAWIESTRAAEVYVTGACAEDIAKKIGAKVIGPPQQMALFG